MNKKTKKGSVLAYSLIIITAMVAVVSSISIATVIEKKGASSTQASVQALQVADSGIQLAIKKINKSKTETDPENQKIENVFTKEDSSNICEKKTIGLNDFAVIKDADDAGVDGANYDLYFYEKNSNPGGDPIPISDCDEVANKITYIKSVGKYKNTVRAEHVTLE